MERTTDQVEWQKSGSKDPRHAVGIGCLPDRLGSIKRGRTDRGALVQTGEGISHKLSGATSGNTSCQDIPERAGKQTCTVVNRQSNSSRVHKQSGRDSLRPGDHPGKAALDVVSRERDPDLSSVPPRRGERQSRDRVTGDEGLLRLEAESLNISEDSGSLPGPRHRHVRVSSFLPAPTVFQLEVFYNFEMLYKLLLGQDYWIQTDALPLTAICCLNLHFIRAHLDL